MSATPTGDYRRNQRANSEDALDAQTKELVNLLFARFMAIYGHRFKSAFQGLDEIKVAKREWAFSLRGYPESLVARAVDLCKEQYAWVPSISEFLGLLKQALGDLGVPPVQTAYQEACRFADQPRQHAWSHPVVYHAGRQTEWFRLRSLDSEQMFPEFEFHYDRLCRLYMQGEELDVPAVQALPDHSNRTLVTFTLRWAEQNGVDIQLAATLLYYLHKPKGSATRQTYRALSEQRLQELGLALPLPDDAET